MLKSEPKQHNPNCTTPEPSYTTWIFQGICDFYQKLDIRSEEEKPFVLVPKMHFLLQHSRLFNYQHYVLQRHWVSKIDYFLNFFYWLYHDTWHFGIKYYLLLIVSEIHWAIFSNKYDSRVLKRYLPWNWKFDCNYYGILDQVEALMDYWFEDVYHHHTTTTTTTATNSV